MAGRRRDAAAMLAALLHPELLYVLWFHMYGDKELFWLSFALAGREPGLNTVGLGFFGLPKGEDAIEPLTHAIAQFVPDANGGDWEGFRTFYVQGDGVEQLVRREHADPRGMGLVLGQPMSFWDPRQILLNGFEEGDCMMRHFPVPERFWGLLDVYASAYEELA
jgi:hypothetical protein